MKKSKLLLALFILGVFTFFTSCGDSAQKVEDAEANVKEAKEDLAQARQDYLADVESYKQQTAVKIAANNKSIADFKIKIEKEKKEVKAEYQLKIAELEQKNSEMEMKLEGYKAEDTDKWERFKAEFSKDMDELGTAFKNLTVKNN